MAVEHCDVLIVGAGLSGIGAAVHLREQCPDKRFLILEGREAMGGTWDLFRYPGIRSDSDMHTLGYNFKPWLARKAIADGPSILEYIHETAAEYGVEEHIRYRHKVKTAAWSSEESRWLVTVEQDDHGQSVQVSCNFLLMCSGYYSYRAGHTPHFEGSERFGGQIVHPQQWPENLDYSGKRVIVIGSGATAMTLVPAMAKEAGHVVMLQRSPTYVISRPDVDRLSNLARKILPQHWAYRLTRWKNITLQQRLYRKTRDRPEWVRQELLKRVRKALGPDYDVEKHFTPSYDPWDQRLCLVPNDDLFEAINSGKASVVTEQIACFTESGVQLASGEVLPADIIVTATGLQLVAAGEVRLSVDDQAVNLADTWSYRGVMYSGVPNLATTFGYINASWTLRADLIAEYVCRLIRHMDDSGTKQVVPRLLEEDKNMEPRPWIDHFSAGYMQRDMHLFPKQGDKSPWTNPQDYGLEREVFEHEQWNDGRLSFQ
jgi:cation diffusion facilitator CzcD-associated flavoprotein CzcO